MPVNDKWSPTSWQSCPAAQQAQYPDAAALQRELDRLRMLPPLVTSWGIERLRDQLADAAEGRRFLLQGGDCAEMLADCRSDIIANKLKILMQMSLVIMLGLKQPVIRVGRFAGQYAKPRSSDTETIDGVTLPSYRGDMVNAPAFTEAARTPDPTRLVQAYQHAALTLNFIRSLTETGFADLHHPEYWDVTFFQNSHVSREVREKYERMLAELSEAIRFMEAVGDQSVDSLSRVEFYASHEALHLPYEASQTRTVPRRTGYYNLTTHLPWIGDRTRSLDGAHVEYMRGIRNPIGIKAGPSIRPEELRELVERLDPEAEPGRMVVITRFGARRVAEHLPPLIEAVRATGRKVVWVSDPMHGNTIKTGSGHKTRDFDSILRELDQCIAIHRAHESVVGGVHFEMTGEDVTECVGGASGVREQDLSQNYTTSCDPRLNSQQALEMAFLIAERLGAGPL
jgi:3-deoxy-7-phosphoheptulonate synthase